VKEHRNHVVAKLEGSPSFPQITNRPIPIRDSPLLANLLATRSPCLPPWCACTITEPENACFWHAPARIALIKLICEADFRTLEKGSLSRLQFHATCRTLLDSE
jgi:hypothetical protein